IFSPLLLPNALKTTWLFFSINLYILSSLVQTAKGTNNSANFRSFNILLGKVNLLPTPNVVKGIIRCNFRYVWESLPAPMLLITSGKGTKTRFHSPLRNVSALISFFSKSTSSDVKKYSCVFCLILSLSVASTRSLGYASLGLIQL